MKLRIEDDTLRLRLSEAEVREFADTGHVMAAVHFGAASGQQLTYALARGSELPQSMAADEPVQVHYEPGAITVLVPFVIARAWTETNQNGFSHELPVAETQHLRILVEKDLDCHH